MKPPVISIITTVYNGMPLLKECIDSVLLQDFADWELLISDDGSKDSSRQYLDELADPRIKVFKQEKNLGIFGNLNFLFNQASAPISQILCQDDYFAGKTSLSTIVQYWQSAAPEIGFARFNHPVAAAADRRILNMQAKTLPERIAPDQANLFFFVFGNIPGNLSNVSLRTFIVAELGFFNQALPYAGDFEFWIRAANKFDMGIQNSLVVVVRRHEKVASNFLNVKGELYKQHLVVYKMLIDKLSPLHANKKLITFFNTQVGSFHLRNAIQAALHGNFTYLNVFIKTRSAISWPKWFRFIACLPYAMFNSSQKYTIKQARELIDRYAVQK